MTKPHKRKGPPHTSRALEPHAVDGLLAALSPSLRLDDVLRGVAASAAALMRAPLVTIWIADERARTVERRAVSDERFAAGHPAVIQRFGEGGAGWVAAERHPLFVPSIAGDRRLLARDWFRSRGFTSYAGLPILFEGSVLGVLSIIGHRPFKLGPGDRDRIEAFLAQAAVAIRNARLFAESEAQARLARTLTESLDVAEVAKRTVESVVLLFGARSSGLRLLQPDGSLQSVARSDRGGAHSDPGDVLPPGMGISRRAVAERRAVRVANVLTEPGVVLPERLRERVLAAGEIAFMAVPLQVKEQIIGALTVADREGREFSDAEAVLLQAFADQAASAISNAQLYEREKAARARAESSEAALRESEERFRSVIENASDLITVLTAEGVIEYESPSVERLLGWRPEELIGKQVMDYVHPDDAGLLADAIAKRLAEPPSVNPPVEFRVRARDGSWRVLAATSRVSRGETGATALVATSRDVTERRMLEEQLLQAQRLESVGRLAGGVAHDFNNLLTVIGGRAQLLLSRLRPGEPMRRDVELIQKTGARAAQLTQQLLAFSRRQVLQPKILDLNEVVTGLESMLRRLIGEHIELVTGLAQGLDSVRADPGQLEQVIMNLALNARDAMPSGGRLTIQTAKVAVGARDPMSVEPVEPGPYVLLLVGDTGVGMDEVTCAHIFEPFFTTKDVGKGTGLGLSTVYGIVRQSGGHITVESEPGRGTTFAIYLPAVHEVAPAREPSQSLEDAPRGVETILLVEDEAEVRDLAHDILKLSGYRVLEATTPEEAERICRDEQSPIHLLLTDVVMPYMSGRILAERLTVARPAMRVLYMSGYTDDTIVQHGVLGQGPAFLPKPFTPNDLSRKVREVLDEGV